MTYYDTAVPTKRWYASLGGLVVATWAHLVAVANPGGPLPGRRYRETYVAGVDGSVPAPMARWGERRWQLPVRVLPYSDAGLVTHAAGWMGHLVDNRSDLLAAVTPSDALIDVRLRVPDGVSATSWRELQADAGIYEEADVNVDPKVVWDVQIPLTLHRPTWRELPAVELSASTGHSFGTGGSAPVFDPTLTFAGDGTWTDGTSTIEIAGSSSPVTVRRATTGEWEVIQGGVLAMHLLGPATNGRFPRWPARTTITTSGTASVAISFYRAWW